MADESIRVGIEPESLPVKPWPGSGPFKPFKASGAPQITQKYFAFFAFSPLVFCGLARYNTGVKRGNHNLSGTETMPQLPAFDYAAWLKGLTLDFTPWNGAEIKIKKGKPAKKVREIEPSIHVLAADEHSEGKSVEELRAVVDTYGDRYDRGFDLFDDVPVIVADKDEQRGVAKERKNPPWREQRKTGHTNLDGLKLLATAFKALHELQEKEKEEQEDKARRLRWKSSY